MKTTQILIACLLTSLPCFSQYSGGENDGYTLASAFGTKLNGEIASFSVLYRSGNGDGFDTKIQNVLLSSNTLAFYNGGRGDGFSNYATVEILSGENLAIIYNGANGDGFNNQLSIPLTLNNVDVSELYKGNVGDGHALQLLADVVLQGFTTEIYNGGIADGFSTELVANVLLLGFMTDIYGGGNGDGFANLIKSENFLSGLITQLFNGGAGDGYSSELVTSSLTLDIIEEMIRLDILLFPNPASHLVQIKPPENMIIQSIVLVTMSGKEIQMPIASNNTIDVSNMADGMYIVTIFTETGAATKKLIVKK